MCRGTDMTSSCSPTSSDLKWDLAREEDCWKLTMSVAEKVDVDLSPDTLRLSTGSADPVVLTVPLEAQPVDVDAARVSLSKKRQQLVVRWPFLGKADAPTQDACREDLLSSTSSTASTEEAAEPLPSADESSPQAETEAPSVSEPSTPREVEADHAPNARTDSSVNEETTGSLGEAADNTTSGTGEATGSMASPEPASSLFEAVAASASSDKVIQEMSADKWKAMGNDAVKEGDYGTALDNYSAGLEIEPDHAILLSNRALCLHKLERLEDGLADAQRCAELRPDFVKGFLRGALILRDLCKPQEALELLRRAPLHVEVEKLSAEIKPEAAAAEERRINALDGAERKKEEGNALFKKGLFEMALPVYDEALSLCADPVGELALAIRNNRAGCYHQLSDFHSVIEDSSFVLAQQPGNVKALLRRMIAFEPLEKYEEALCDARAVLRQFPNHEAAGKVQHRLSKLVRDRERERAGESAIGR